MNRRWLRRTLSLLLLAALLPGGLRAAEPAVASAATEDFVLPPRESFNATVERPLFSPTRRGLGGGPVADPVRSVAAGAFLLVGVAADPDGQGVALVREQGSGRQFRVRSGDALNGWRIARVSRSGLALTAAGSNRDIAIGDALPAAP